MRAPPTEFTTETRATFFLWLSVGCCLNWSGGEVVEGAVDEEDTSVTRNFGALNNGDSCYPTQPPARPILDWHLGISLHLTPNQ